jgi:hypothetical protein
MGCLLKTSAVALAAGLSLGALSLPTAADAAWRFSQSVEQPTPSTDQSTSQGQPTPAQQTATPAPSDQGDTAKTKSEDGTPATVIDDRDAEAILGKSVYSTANEDMGRIVDVIVKRNGEVRAALIDFGGFLGVGSRKIAVDWSALRFPASGPMDHIILELTRDQVRLAPEFKSGEPLVVLGATTEGQPNPEPPATEH